MERHTSKRQNRKIITLNFVQQQQKLLVMDGCIESLTSNLVRIYL